MKFNRTWLLVITIVVWSGFCIAQTIAPSATPVPADLPPVIPTADWLMLLVVAIGGMKGLSALGIAAAGSQLLLKFMSTPLAKFSGKYRLLAITGLTMVSGVLALMTASDISFMAALLHSTTLAAFQVFIHQVWKQVVQKRNETA